MALRWRLQFGLRWLLLAVTVIAVWLGAVVNDAHRQREAVAHLSKRNWLIRYDYRVAAYPISSRPVWANRIRVSRAPEWLRKWLGDDLFCNVVKVWQGYPGLRTTGADLEQLAAFRHLKELHAVMHVELSDASLSHLGRLRELEELSLSGNIRKSALRHVSTLQNLRRLDLDDAWILETRDAGITNGHQIIRRPARSANWPSLRDLTMLGTSGAPVALGELRAAPDLRSADLRRCGLTDDDLNMLTGWQRLEELHLSDNPFGDAGVLHLQALTNLKTLRLDDTDVSNACLDHVAPLKNLKLFTVQRTWVTETAIVEFKRSHPDTELGWRENSPYFDIRTLSWISGPRRVDAARR